MPPKATTAVKAAENSKKRKQPAEPAGPNKRQKSFKASRNVETQRAVPTEIDLAKYVAAREFEIRALDEHMRMRKGASNQRAFQQIPREMRRRTASHNVKKVPKRLRRRAAKEV